MIRKLFYGENLFFRLMGRLGDFMCLNILCVLTSLPVFTAGASMAALYEVLRDIGGGREGGCVRRYIKAFQKNFSRATTYWLICMLAAVFLMLGILGMSHMGGETREFFLAMSVFLGFLWIGMLSFGMILISWTDFSIRQAFYSAVLITIGSFPWLILNLLISGMPILAVIAGNKFVLAFLMPLFMLFGIPLLGYMKTYVYRRVLKKYGLVNEGTGNDCGAVKGEEQV